MPRPDTHSELVEQLRAGAEHAAAEVYRRYAQRLLALARARLGRKLQRRLDADDVVQSAYRSFFVRARQGEFCLDTAEDLWRLLAAIVINKLRQQAKRHRARRRAVGREEHSPDVEGSSALEVAASREPSTVDLLIAADELTWLFSHLSPPQRVAVERRLEQQPVESIAAELNVSERTIGRWLSLARELLLSRQAEDNVREKAADTQDLQRRIEPLRDQGIPLISPRDYLLERMIGSGGVSKVYLARNRLSGEQVCLKVLRKNLRGRSALVDSFISEAQLVHRLTHPHIVPIIAAGVMPDGGMFLAMPWIDGTNLAVHLAQARPTLAECLTIAQTVADALDYAHARGVLHCDIKPQNILIESTGKVWLTDFGFGRLVGKTNIDAHRAAIAGTVHSMAPEQLQPDLAPINEKTDVYALGKLIETLLQASQPANTPEKQRIQECLTAVMQPMLKEMPTERITLAECQQHLQMQLTGPNAAAARQH